MGTEGKKAIVLVDNAYQEMEVWYPLYRLREAGIETILVGPVAGQTFPSKLGYPATSDKAAADVSMADYDALVIPGGYAPDYLRRNAAVIQLCSDAMATNKVVGAICHAGWLLCSTPGALKGRKVTSFFAIKDDMTNAGAVWSDADVVRDGNLITSRKPDDLPAFMKAMLSALSE